MKTFVAVTAVKVGDTLCFANPPSQVTVEHISDGRCDGKIGLHGNDDTWSCFYGPQERVRIAMRGVALAD